MRLDYLPVRKQLLTSEIRGGAISYRLAGETSGLVDEFVILNSVYVRRFDSSFAEGTDHFPALSSQTRSCKSSQPKSRCNLGWQLQTGLVIHASCFLSAVDVQLRKISSCCVHKWYHVLTSEPADIHAVPQTTSRQMDALAICLACQVVPRASASEVRTQTAPAIVRSLLTITQLTSSHADNLRQQPSNVLRPRS